jgi:transposase
VDLLPLPPQPPPKSLRRATRRQRRERHRADAEQWAATEARGLLRDVSVEGFLPLVNAADGNRLPVLGQPNPWSDAVLGHENLSQLDAGVDRPEAGGNDTERGPVGRCWREPDLMLRWYGD